MIENLIFHKVPKKGSLIGFVSFRYNNEVSFTSIGCHKLLKPKGSVKVRLLFPETIFPSNKRFQEDVDVEISAYIEANYPEVLNG